MTHPRTVSGGGFGNSVRYRVSACRKRLRYSRSTHRTPAHLEQDAQSGEIESCSTPSEDPTGVVLAAADAENEAESA